MDVKYDVKSGIAVPKFGFRSGWIIFVGFLCMLTLGALHSFGNFAPYIISFLRSRTADTNLRNVDAAWILGIGFFASAIGMSFGGVCAHRFGPRMSTFVGAVFYSGAMFLSYLSVQHSFYSLVATHGVLGKFGMFFVYGGPVQTAVKWFPKRRTLVVGLVVSGLGCGALVFNPIITGFINPDNVSPDFVTENGERYFTQPEILDRVPLCYLVLGACYFGLLLTGIIFLHDPPSKVIEEDTRSQITTKGIVPVNGNTQITFNKQDKAKQNAPENINVALEERDIPNLESNDAKADQFNCNGKELSHLEATKLLLRSRSFYVCWFATFCLFLGFLFVSVNYKSYGQQFISDDHFLALAGSIAAVFNCIGRPVFGVLMDRFGFRVTVRIISIGFSVTVATLQLTEYMHRGLFMLWICSAYFFFAGMWSVMPSTMSKLFGVRNLALSFGFIEFGTGMAGLIGSIVASTLKAKIGWNGLFSLAGGVIAVPFLFSFLFNGQDLHGKPI